MTEAAVPGTPHQTLPDWLAYPEEAGLAFVVIPWLCPRCEQPVAETLVSREQRLPQTHVIGFSPVRMAEADEDGVPFYGPSPRRLRGKSERRSSERMQRGAMDRRGDKAHPDHAPVYLAEFETICWDCLKRMRITLPNG